MIQKIKWDNHPILKNLELNFLKGDETPFNTIILAGENGTGKTTILETLSTFLGRRSFAPFEYIQHSIGSTNYTLSKINDDNAEYGFHNRKNENTGVSIEIRSNINNNANTIEEDSEDIRHYGIAYTKARSGFTTKIVKTVTTEKLDTGKSILDANDDYTHIKQLLIDIDTDDSREIKAIIDANEDTQERIAEYRKSAKMSRFREAFDNFFETLRFDNIISEPNDIKINFKKNNSLIPIDQLSTGEKQIVFRGASLLKNANTLNGGIILIDEPELSMHPKWQEKILGYYRGLFTIDGNQTTQIIVATHSEYVVKAALEDKDNVLIIVLSDREGTINATNMTAPLVLPTITSAELNYVAFNVVSNDYHIELYGYLQNKTGKKMVKECDEYIKASAQYNSLKHAKASCFTNIRGHAINYETLPTFIRNKIDHPQLTSTANEFTQDELRCSIELLIELCKNAVSHV